MVQSNMRHRELLNFSRVLFKLKENSINKEEEYEADYFVREDWEIIGSENGKLSFFEVDGDALMIGGY